MNDFQFYFGFGWEHIISTDALDHLLFLAALAAVYTLRQWKQALILATAFTVGHTVSLVAGSRQWLTVDATWVEFLVPCTIVATAVSNLFQKSFTPKSVRLNYALALVFGLIHGLAFANVLQLVLAKEQSFGSAVFSFAAGLEAGQLLVVFAVLLLCHLFTGVLKAERRHWVIFVSAAVFALSLEMAAQRWPWRKNGEYDAVQKRIRRNANDFPAALLNNNPHPTVTRFCIHA